MGKPIKHSPVQNAQAAVSQQRLAFFAQKREAFYVNAIVGLLNNPATKVEDVDGNCDLALKYADTMFNRLYVVRPQEGKESEQ